MRRNTKSFSFLLEFILVLLFFSISSAICVHIQADASQMNKKANDTKIALQIIQNYMSDKEKTPILYDEKGNPSQDGYFQIIEKKKDDMIEVSVVVEEEILVSLPYYNGGDV